MEEKKKVWIKGRKGRGSEIKGILTGLGAKAAEVICEDGDCIYFINHDNEIDCVPGFSTELAQIIKDNYREIKLPRQEWEDGDVLVFDKYPGCYALFKKYCNAYCFEAYFIIDGNSVIFNETASVGNYHLASEKELEDVGKAFYTMCRNFYDASKKLERK